MKSDKELIANVSSCVIRITHSLTQLRSLDGARNAAGSLAEAVDALADVDALRNHMNSLRIRYQKRVVSSAKKKRRVA
jgi:hypothetical protein